MSKRGLKLLLILGTLFLIISSISLESVSAATVNTKKSRVTYTLKDANGKSYQLYVIGSSEKKKRASYDDSDFAMVWAGANEGDLMYHGNYKFYIRKSGSKSVTYTGYQKKGYTYNATRKMMYMIPSKYKGQPDLFAIASTESSNFEFVDIYYISKGKLKKAKHGLGYTLRPQNIYKDGFRIASYNNAVAKWDVLELKFNSTRGTFTKVKLKKYNFDSLSYKDWRKDWK
ncbi:hypothetical protein SM124_09035 [Bacillus sp. 31A1R]|uniref:Uncharacterized protein n=1 Tax=Robertmurraya mangrovi TaxID=3098077 RepID=A0ABU5IXQ9_9BACI|nr:hypothetical protein [Bacillus sp. 31A1R]MDZ5471892.1 hypothetical protein [Bacillus sp. 31A1R]